MIAVLTLPPAYTLPGVGLDPSWLAALNSTTGALGSWSPQLDGPVYALGINGSLVYVGGLFFNVGLVACARAIRSSA